MGIISNIKSQQSSGGGSLLSQARNLKPIEQPTSGIAGVGLGVLKGLGSTVTGLGELTSKGLSYLPGEAGKFFEGGVQEAKRQQETNLKAEGTAQKVGKGIEQIAEFFIPASKLAKADKAMDLLISGSKLIKSAKIAAKIGSSAAIEGLGAGAVTLAQTGGDLKEAAKTAATAGVLRGGMKAAGEAVRAVKIPEKLYSRIFKNELETVKNEFKVGRYGKLAETNPDKYAEAVNIGLIKNGQLNETLAKQALERGLKGSLSTMANKVIDDTVGLELAAKQAVKNKTIKLVGTKKLANTMKEIVDEYKNIGQGEIAEKAGSFIKGLETGKINGDKLLELRRFLDGMRVRSSYNPSARLSLGQENMKYWSDFMRQKVNNIPGLDKIMKDYSFNIKAFDSLAKEAAKRNNKELLGLFDMVLLGTGNIVPAVAVKAGRTAAATTNIAQALNKGVASGIGLGTRGAVSDTANELIQ